MSDDLITDFFGSPIGRLKKDIHGTTEASDYCGSPLGKADDKNGTRDYFGMPISPQNVPGLLFSKEHNPMLKEKEEERKRQEASERENEERRKEQELRVEESQRRAQEMVDRQHALEEEDNRKNHEDAQAYKEQCEKSGEYRFVELGTPGRKPWGE